MKQALADALEKRGYDTLTPVQEAVTDPELQEADLLVSAQTGSGKTVGFGLALAPTLLDDAEQFGRAAAPLALIIAPTRELALQVKRELSWLYGGTGAIVTSCVGGMDMRDERRALARGAHIVVATPGRLRDHIMRGSIDLAAIRAVVLDEADEMLDLGFREDLEFILGEAPETRRTLMFSATVPRAIANLAKSYQKDAVRVSTQAEKSQHADIEYQLMNVAPRDTENAIINVLRFHEVKGTLVFANTRAMVNRLTTRLSNRGFAVVALSGELSQSERTHALQAMRDGRARVCVATDVAARGIDLPSLDLVIHAELPNNHETLLHRSGRTGRAGRKGTSVLIAPPPARRKAERILKSAKLTAQVTDAPSADAVRARDVERMMGDPAWQDAVSEGEAEAVAQLVGAFNLEQLAAAYLRLYTSRQSAPEELSDPGAKPKPRAPFGPSVWFSITGGRARGAEPRRYLPMLIKAGKIGKDDIGAIRVQQSETFVEISEAAVAGFLKTLGDKRELEPGAVITRLASPPAIAGSPRPKYTPKDGRPGARAQKGSGPKTSAPVEWNDDPAPRKRKPKPSARTAPHRKGARPEQPEPNAIVEPRTPRKPKGPPPPKGKKNSKKNKARKKLATAAKTMARKSKAPARGKSGSTPRPLKE